MQIFLVSKKVICCVLCDKRKFIFYGRRGGGGEWLMIVIAIFLTLTSPLFFLYIQQQLSNKVKNIHFFATLIDHVAKELDVEVGEYTHWITNLCFDRGATSC